MINLGHKNPSLPGPDSSDNTRGEGELQRERGESVKHRGEAVGSV